MQTEKHYPLAQCDITEKEISLVRKVLTSGRLSQGDFLKSFEQSFMDTLHVSSAVGVSSGTAALQCLVKAHGIGTGDEVITTSYSFVASTNCILYAEAVPKFVDIDPASWVITPETIEAAITKKTKAILPVHVFGHPCNMVAIEELAKRYNLEIIEDACEALGAWYWQEEQKRLVGSGLGSAAFAFYPNKQITTGEGGMVVTNDPTIELKCRMMANQGRYPNDPFLVHQTLGYNFKLDEMSAALGWGQMSRLESILEKRAEVAEYYNTLLGGSEFTDFIQLPAVHYGRSWFTYVVKLSNSVDRSGLMRYLSKYGIETRPYFPAIHQQPYYHTLGLEDVSLPITEDVASSTLALPFYIGLSQYDVQNICHVLADAIKHNLVTRSPTSELNG